MRVQSNVGHWLSLYMLLYYLILNKTFLYADDFAMVVVEYLLSGCSMQLPPLPLCI
jgi:hypothetical protein